MNWLTDKQVKRLKELGIKHYKYITYEEAKELIHNEEEIQKLETSKDIARLEKLLSNASKFIY